MSCDNCYNGCPNTVPDRCVKYTGIDIDALEISTNDPLSLVLDKVTTAITEMFKGNGIVPRIDPAIICDLVKNNLPCCDVDVELNTLLEAIIKTICDIDLRIVALEEDIEALNADYTIDSECFEDLESDAETHDIVQALMDKLCIVASDLEALTLDLNTNYVKKSEFDELVTDYLESVPSSDKYYTKMVPYTVVAYFGPLTGLFDSSGAGIGVWEKINLCNGAHGTPDLRGLVIAGATNMAGGGAMDARVDPAKGNPAYIPLNETVVGSHIQGENFVTLKVGQIPTHSHTPTVNVTDPDHTHTVTQRYTKRADFANNEYIVDIPNNSTTNTPIDITRTTSASKSGVGVTVSIGNAGQDQAHINNQPTVGATYIMYVP